MASFTLRISFEARFIVGVVILLFLFQTSNATGFCDTIPCQNGASCFENSNLSALPAFYCLCPPGFTGPTCEIGRKNCTTALPCNLINSDQHSHYIMNPQLWFSVLRSLLSEAHKADVDDCEYTPCLNNGTCVDLVNSFRCICPSAFTGDSCQTVINQVSATEVKQEHVVLFFLSSCPHRRLTFLVYE